MSRLVVVLVILLGAVACTRYEPVITKKVGNVSYICTQSSAGAWGGVKTRCSIVPTPSGGSTDKEGTPE